jgi:hypothetical protein
VKTFSNRIWVLALLVTSATLIGCEQGSDHPRLTGDYLGQQLPEEVPELFAPGIVSTGQYERDLTMTPDGDEIYFGISVGRHTYSTILMSRRQEGRWTEPEVPPFAADPDLSVAEPFISPDGLKFFFISDRPRPGEETGDHDIWVMDREGDRWGKPYNLGSPVNTTAREFFPSVTLDGTLYFCRAVPETGVHYIYRSRLVDRQYSEPERLPEAVNCGRSMFNAGIAPDESYLIVPVAGREDTYGGVDYFICFRDDQDNWHGPVNMGPQINTAGSQEYSPFVTADGRYLFFMSCRQTPGEEPITYRELLLRQQQPGNGNSDIYWVSTSFIEALKVQAMNPDGEVDHE